MISVPRLRRLYEAAKRDMSPADVAAGRQPEVFFEEFGEALSKREIHAKDISIRALFENFVEGGREVVDSWNPRHGDQGEGITMALLEETGAVTSGGFGKISGQIVYNAILQAYENEEFKFSPLVETVPTQFNGEKIAGISQIGDESEAIAEGRPYPQAGVSEDYIETPVTTKHGLIVGLTREAIFFDRTNVLVQRCSQVGFWLGINKEKRIIDMVIDENTTNARYKWKGTVYGTYQSSTPWVNLKATNGITDWSNVDAAELVLNQITDPYTGEPVVLDHKHLVVTRNNLMTAKRILTATNVATYTPGFATTGNPNRTEWSNPIEGYTLVWSAQLAARMATKTSWYIGDVRKAFMYMENWPMQVVQAPANSEVEFTSDVVMRWKASERGAAATRDPRYMCKNTVA